MAAASRDWRPGFERWVVRFAIACPCAAVALTLAMLFARPEITPAEHRDAVAVFVPNRVIDGTERLSPAARTDVCVMEREAWLRRKYSVQPANDFARFLVYSFARVNCLLH